MTETGSVTGGPQDQRQLRRMLALRQATGMSSRVRPRVRRPTTTKSAASVTSVPSAPRTAQISAVPCHRSARDAGWVLGQRRCGAGALRGEGEVQTPGDGGEPIAAGLHLGDEAVERGHGLGPVAAGVVEQDDRAGITDRRHVPDDCVDAGARPVFAVRVVDDDEVAVAPRLLEDLPVLVVERLGLRGVREAQQGAVDTRGARDDVAGLRVLHESPPLGDSGEVGVGEGMDAELVTVRGDPSRQVGGAGHLGAEHEEGRLGSVLAEDVEDLRRPLWIWSVVEREGDRLVG